MQTRPVFVGSGQPPPRDDGQAALGLRGIGAANVGSWVGGPPVAVELVVMNVSECLFLLRRSVLPGLPGGIISQESGRAARAALYEMASTAVHPGAEEARAGEAVTGRKRPAPDNAMPSSPRAYDARLLSFATR